MMAILIKMVKTLLLTDVTVNLLHKLPSIISLFLNLQHLNQNSQPPTLVHFSASFFSNSDFALTSEIYTETKRVECWINGHANRLLLCRLDCCCHDVLRWTHRRPSDGVRLKHETLDFKWVETFVAFIRFSFVALVRLYGGRWWLPAATPATPHRVLRLPIAFELRICLWHLFPFFHPLAEQRAIPKRVTSSTMFSSSTCCSAKTLTWRRSWTVPRTTARSHSRSTCSEWVFCIVERPADNSILTLTSS